MTTDGRRNWELEYCLRLSLTKVYLDMLDTEGTKRQLIVNAYGVNGEFDQWCLAHIQAILERCDAMTEKNGPLSDAALTVARPYGERAMELYQIERNDR